MHYCFIFSHNFIYFIFTKLYYLLYSSFLGILGAANLSEHLKFDKSPPKESEFFLFEAFCKPGCLWSVSLFFCELNFDLSKLWTSMNLIVNMRLLQQSSITFLSWTIVWPACKYCSDVVVDSYNEVASKYFIQTLYD